MELPSPACPLPAATLAAAIAAAAGCGEPLQPQPAGGVGVPALERCDPVRQWTGAAIELENELAEHIADAREAGGECGSRGTFDPAPPLQRNGALICAARLHSLDMATRDFVGHDNPDDASPWDRIRAVEYAFATADEVIAAGPLTATEVFEDAFIAREGSCAAMLSDPYVDVGIGVHVASDSALAHTFTVLLAKPIDP